MFLYIIMADFGLKVGKSSDPEYRRKMLLKQYGVPMTIQAVVPVKQEWALDAAYLAHQYLSEYHLFGEWYNCEVRIAKAAILKAARDHESVDRGGQTKYLEKLIIADGLIRFISDSGGVTTKKEIKAELGSNVGHALRRLRNAGLIEPWEDKVALTERGRAFTTTVLKTLSGTPGEGQGSSTPSQEGAPCPRSTWANG